MNKELIKKYKAEFDHWLNGGELLYAYIDDTFSWKNMNAIDKNIYPVYARNPFQISEHHIIIINDEYATYRKALAEGKIVEVATDYNDVDGYIWKSMEDEEFHHFSIDEIRIKPEEPKFKVGDWVVEIHSTTKAQVLELFGNQIRVKFCYPDAIITTDSSDFIPWVPKNGDWCWFWVDGQDYHDLRKLNKTDKHTSPYITIPIGRYKFCEPFIGNLPTLSNK